MTRWLRDWLLWPLLVAVAAAGCVWMGWRAHALWGAPEAPAVILRTGSGDAELPADSVVANVATGVYHAPTCGHAGRILDDRRAIYDSPAAAEADGLRPCRFCGDPR